MVIPALTYTVLAITGVIGSGIAWQDLRVLKKAAPKARLDSPCN